jgi:hypothetical protein
MYVAKCLPSALDTTASTSSFLLPFKIADSASLCSYSKVLTDANPTFLPPYRKNEMCDDNLHHSASWSKIDTIQKRKLSHIEGDIVAT